VPDILLSVAVMVAVPASPPVASPLSFFALETFTTLSPDDFQTADL
jgi:hypothetical protein